MHALVDDVGYLVIFLRDNEELHCLTSTVDDIVADVGCHEGEAQTIDDRLGAVEEEIGRGDDTHVYHLHGTSETHSGVFAKQGYKYVGASC